MYETDRFKYISDISISDQRDIYDFNVFFLNNLLSAVGFQEKNLESVYDFDLARFTLSIRGLKKQAHRSALQELLLRYYHVCELRITQGPIFDYRYKEVTYFESYSNARISNMCYTSHHISGSAAVNVITSTEDII